MKLGDAVRANELSVLEGMMGTVVAIFPIGEVRVRPVGESVHIPFYTFELDKIEQ